MASLSERFWTKHAANPNTGCWDWTGSRSPGGYGRIYGSPGRSPLYAHRVSYELLVGPIPDELTIDHLCRNSACVNPAHMEVVTMAENVRRGKGSNRKIHCKRGHPMSGENLKFDGEKRRCRTCANANNRAYKDRQAGWLR